MINEILTHLRTADYSAALTLLQSHTAASSYAAACGLLAQCTGHDREALRVLLVDLLSGYPKQLWGIPCVLKWSAATEKRVTLPIIDSLDCPGNTLSATWLPMADLLAKQPGPSPAIWTNRAQVVLLLLLPIEATDSHPSDTSWLASIFGAEVPPGEHVQMSSAEALVYPEAIEGASTLHTLIRSHEIADRAFHAPQYFLSDSSYAAVIEFAKRQEFSAVSRFRIHH